jgi:hypothetical protein
MVASEQVNSDSMVINLQARGDAGYSFVMEHYHAKPSNSLNWQLIAMFPVRSYHRIWAHGSVSNIEQLVTFSFAAH